MKGIRKIIIIAWVFYATVNHAQISLNYPNDAGIENDPDVWFVEKFDGALEDILSRYATVVNAEGMSLTNDCPDGLQGGRSLKIASIQGQNSGGYLYRHFPEGFDGELYIRYYVKHPASSRNYFHHEGVWVGGYNPSLEWPYPRAGICGLGESRFAVAYEIMDSSWLHPYTHIAPYIYWGDMRSFPDGACWGNFLQCGNHNPPPEIRMDEWVCVEMMIRLNDPPSATNGELKTWINGVETGHWGEGFPNGSWVWGNFFIDPDESPFEGFRWRTSAEQLINYLWIQFYHDHPEAPSSHILYDNLVIARKYIGPVYDPGTQNENVTKQHSINIIPNPAKLSVQISNLEPDSDVALLDMNGYEVFSAKADIPSIHIATRELVPGVYFVRIRFGDQETMKKLVILSE